MAYAHIGGQFPLKLIYVLTQRRNPVGIERLLDKFLLFPMNRGGGQEDPIIHCDSSRWHFGQESDPHKISLYSTTFPYGTQGVKDRKASVF